MYDLSVCLAAIRKDNWKRLYDSIVNSIGDYSFELIFCGPHKEPPEELANLDNVRCIQDFGPPTRAQQISMRDATGRYITWTADDGWFLEGGLEKCIKQLDEMSAEKNGLGDPNSGMYCMNFHEPVRSPFYPNNYLIFNSVILPTQYFKELGGFDCRFEACPMAFVDFGARAQIDGIQTKLEGVIFECTQFPGTSGDHAPIHHAQIGHDQPLYKRIWNSSDCLDRIKIDFDNWKNSPKIWKRRFNEGAQDEY